MKLQVVAAAAERIAAESRRLRMVEEIAGLLTQASPRERAPLVYLLQGQLAPACEGIELGVGDATLVAVLASASGLSRAAVARRYQRAGDLGLVAAALITRSPRQRLALVTLFRELLAVAAVSGEGSQGRKQRRLVALLARLDAVEAKFVVRVVQGRLRLGAGDQTILEAAALAALGDRGRKPLLEHAYNVRSDLGGVVELAFAHGSRGLVGLGPRLGTPVRPALAQRLPSAAAIVKRMGRVQVEPKYDGFRLQLHRDGNKVWAFSRRLENVTAMFPDLARALKAQVRTSRIILDGEAVVHNPETGEFLPFQVTMTRKRKRGIDEMAARYPLRLFAFDLLLSGGRSCLELPQEERTRRLHRLVRGGPDQPIAVTETLLTAKVGELEASFEEMIHRGLEGIVAKRLEAPYRPGQRGYDWVKLKRAYQSKLRDTVDVVLVGYLRGRGKRAALGIGSLLAAVYDPAHDRFRTVARIGSGLTEQAWAELRRHLDRMAVRRRPRRVDTALEPDVWVTPAIVAEVLADEITRSPFHTCGRARGEPGYALRFPRLLGLRPDKGPTDATTEREVLQLFRMQRRAGGKPTRHR
jgi:DNA ligase-1